MTYDEYFDTYNPAVEIVRETLIKTNENSKTSCNNNINKPLQEVVCEK